MMAVLFTAWRKNTIIKLGQVKKHYFYRKVITIMIEMMMMMMMMTMMEVTVVICQLQCCFSSLQ